MIFYLETCHWAVTPLVFKINLTWIIPKIIPQMRDQETTFLRLVCDNFVKLGVIQNIFLILNKTTQIKQIQSEYMFTEE